MRFQRRKKIFPGVKLNFSKSGISTTIGIPGLSVNIGSNGTYLNTGLPGTGLSHRQKLSLKNSENSSPGNPENFEPVLYYSAEEIKSDTPSDITSPSLVEFRNLLNDCLREEKIIKSELRKIKLKIFFWTFLEVILNLLVIGFFWERIKFRRRELKAYESNLLEHLDSCHISLDHNLSQNQLEKYEAVTRQFEALLNSKCIWDVTNSTKVDRVKERSSASNSVLRKKVKFYKSSIRLLKSSFSALVFKNSNGADLYFYPGFILIYESDNSFGLVDFHDVHLNHTDQRFIEEETVPDDSNIVDYTWAKVNKNGSPDKRFKDNYKIPIALYGKLEIQSPAGLNEQWSISNSSNSEEFARAWHNFTKTN